MIEYNCVNLVIEIVKNKIYCFESYIKLYLWVFILEKGYKVGYVNVLIMIFRFGFKIFVGK